MRDIWGTVCRAMAGHPKRVLAVVAAVMAVCAFCARDVRLDNNFAALFATDSDEARFREEFRSTWGPDDGLLVAIIHTDVPADDRLVTLLDKLTIDTALSIPALEEVHSVTNADVLGRSMDGTPIMGPAFGPRSAFTGTIPDRIRLAHESELGSANLLSADGHTFLVVGELKAEYDSYELVVGPAQDFQAKVESLTSASGLPVANYFSGVAYTRIAAIQQMQLDLLRLSPLATFLMAAILWVVFRRIAAVIAPIVAIGASIVVTAGLIGLAGDDLNQVTIIYPILLMGVVVSGSTHLMHRFYRERAMGQSPEESGRAVLENVTRGALIAALTTALGFLSLAIAQMQILHEFGLYLAAGVMAAFVIECAVVPAVLICSRSAPSGRYTRSAIKREARRDDRSERFARWVTRPKVAASVLGVGVLLVLLSILVARTAVYDYALSDSLGSAHPVSQGNAAIDQELNGIIPVEISLQGEPGAFRDPVVLSKVDQLTVWLKDNYGLRATGVSQLVKEASFAVGGPRAIPTDPARTSQLLDLAESYRNGEYVSTLVKDNDATARLRGFTPDKGGRYIGALKQRFEAESRQVLEGTAISARVTGEAPVAYDGMNKLSRELIESTTLALIMIVLALLLVFRNGWLALIATLPNIVPVLLGLAIYRLSTDVLDPLPGVVFCIAMGLAADDTIHLINRWKELCNTASSNREALVEAFVTVRKAMVSSSLVLIAGFLALTLSGFGWNRQLGLLGSLVLLLALGSDLLFGTAGLALLAWNRDRRTATRGDCHRDAVNRRESERVAAAVVAGAR